MTLPLYRTASQRPRIRDPGGHAGLWFDKFCDRWTVNSSDWTMRSGQSDQGNPKLEWIRTVTNGTVGASDQITAYVLRMLRLIDGRDGRAEVFTTESRFVTGLGRSHPVENGFVWHPTLGTPFLPGSSVKGLIRSWAKADADPRPDRETLARLLGEPGDAGRVCCLDAVPLGPVKLEADVMTPLHAGWDDCDPPGDWRSPTPVPFLATAAETPFLFGLVPCDGVTKNDLETVSMWLRDALAWAGGGAKTAVGYGRFCPDDEQTGCLTQRLKDEKHKRRADREQQEARKSPEGRWRLAIHGLSETQVLDMVRIHLEKERLEDPTERRAFAEAVMSMDLVSHWRRGTKREPQTGVGKKKLKERARLVQDALDPDSD